MRTRQEIDAEYSEVAKMYGDRIFKLSNLDQQLNPLRKECEALFAKMHGLSQEQASLPLPEALQVAPEPKSSLEVVP